MSKEIKNYVVGFAFDATGQYVMLIRKNKPAWQKGKLNGVGGHIEAGETAVEAMTRECIEEAGITINWEKVGILRGVDHEGEFNCYVFSAYSNDIFSHKKGLNSEGERVGTYSVSEVVGGPLVSVSSVPILLEFCASRHEGRHAFIQIGYSFKGEGHDLTREHINEEREADARDHQTDSDRFVTSLIEPQPERNGPFTTDHMFPVFGPPPFYPPEKAEAPKPKPSLRGEKLYREASSMINGERQTMYGGPEDSFPMIAERWTQYLRCRGKLFPGTKGVTAEDVAFMMADFKMARECVQGKRDNRVDAVGYLGILDDIALKEAISREAILRDAPSSVDELEKKDKER